MMLQKKIIRSSFLFFIKIAIISFAGHVTYIKLMVKPFPRTTARNYNISDWWLQHLEKPKHKLQHTISFPIDCVTTMKR